MQKATVTIIVESEQDRFSEHASDIYWKTLEKLKLGEYSVEIEQVKPLQ